MGAGDNRPRDSVRGLRSLDEDRVLRRLLVCVLGYEGEGGLVSGNGWSEELDEEPELLATAAREGRFAVIRPRLSMLGKVWLTAEPKVVETQIILLSSNVSKQ